MKAKDMADEHKIECMATLPTLAMEEALVALEIMFIQFDALVQETGTHLPDYEQGDLRDIATARKAIASLTKALGR